MDFNFNNPYNFPWNPANIYMPNGFTRAIVPHQQPGYPGVMNGPHRFPGSVFPFGMNDQNSQFGLNWNNYGNYQNQLTLDQRAPQPGIQLQILHLQSRLIQQQLQQMILLNPLMRLLKQT